MKYIKFVFVILFLFSFFYSSLFAQDVNTNTLDASQLDENITSALDELEENNYDIDYIINNTIESKKLFNENFEKVPEAIKKFFGNEKILFIIDDLDNNSTINLSLKANKGVIEELTLDELEKYTLEIRFNKDKIQSILESKDPVTELKTAIKNKDITYKGKGFIGSIKYFFIKMFSGFFL